ncbi:hypothetical protein BCR36DRAFT_313001, partial [Piromyces finnis]
NNEDNTHVFNACKYYIYDSSSKIIEFLVEKGADINIPNNDGETLIFVLYQKFRKYVVNFFLLNMKKI